MLKSQFQVKALVSYLSGKALMNIRPKLTMKTSYVAMITPSLPAPDSADPFMEFNPQQLTWTPPAGNFSALINHIDRCCHAVNGLDFKGRSQYSLSPAERTALLQLCKRSAIIIIPSDKGGAIVVWSYPLYLVEANQLKKLYWQNLLQAERSSS